MGTLTKQKVTQKEVIAPNMTILTSDYAILDDFSDVGTLFFCNRYED